MIRLFVAIEIQEDAGERLAGVCRGLPRVRWAPREQFHLSLRFIGEVEREIFLNIKEDLQAVKQESFSIALRGLGYFPGPRGPGALWAGVAENEALRELYRLVSSVLEKSGLPPERRPFRPHVTIARLKNVSRGRLTEYLEEYADFETDFFPVNEFLLFSSKLRPQGALHHVEERYPLEAA